jgi:hypothetical protein
VNQANHGLGEDHGVVWFSLVSCWGLCYLGFLGLFLDFTCQPIRLFILKPKDRKTNLVRTLITLVDDFGSG